MTGTDLYKRTHKSVPVIFEPSCIFLLPFWGFMACSTVIFKLTSNLYTDYTSCTVISGFSGLEVACWPLVPKFAGSNPAEAVGFLRVNKNPQHVGGH